MTYPRGSDKRRKLWELMRLQDRERVREVEGERGGEARHGKGRGMGKMGKEERAGLTDDGENGNSV